MPIPCPKPDELVEALLENVILPPEGYEYYGQDGQLLFPVYGQDQWRVLIKNQKTGELIPIFISGGFLLSLTKALHAMQREMNQAIEETPPVCKAVAVPDLIQ